MTLSHNEATTLHIFLIIILYHDCNNNWFQSSFEPKLVHDIFDHKEVSVAWCKTNMPRDFIWKQLVYLLVVQCKSICVAE